MVSYERGGLCAGLEMKGEETCVWQGCVRAVLGGEKREGASG